MNNSEKFEEISSTSFDCVAPPWVIKVKVEINHVLVKIYAEQRRHLQYSN